MASIYSYFKTPLTDLTGTLLTHQYYGRCQGIEMKAINCLEAYGKEHGMEVCNDILSDYEECNMRIKQMLRAEAIRNERIKQGVFEPPPRGDAHRL